LKVIKYKNGDITISAGIGKKIKNCKDSIGCLNCIDEIECLKSLAKRTKSYMITNNDYRSIVSAAFNLHRLQKFKLQFFTFTFAYEPSEIISNKILTRFIKNTKKKYDKNFNYIWTKERQESGRIHYHMLCDVPFMPIKDLQDSFNYCVLAIDNCGVVSNNSVRLPPDDRKIYKFDQIAVAKYIAKYISKERGKAFTQPCFSISRALRDVSEEITIWEAYKLRSQYGCFKEFHKFTESGAPVFGIIKLKNLKK